MSVVADTRATSTGTAIANPAIVFGINLELTATAGQVVIKDGGSGGTTLIDIGSAAKDDNQFIAFEGGGIQFTTDVHISTLTNISGVTFVWRDLAI